MQDVMVRGASLADVRTNLFVMAGFATAMLAIGLPRFTYVRRGGR
jgi:hypothetical protein